MQSMSNRYPSHVTKLVSKSGHKSGHKSGLGYNHVVLVTIMYTVMGHKAGVTIQGITQCVSYKPYNNNQ